MSILLPVLALVLALLFSAYHRYSLAVFTALAATLLVAVALIGANFTATVVCAVVLALGSLPLLITPIDRKSVV